jgi:hypothetical protein
LTAANDVHLRSSNPPCLVAAEQLGGRASGRLFLEIDIGELLAVVVPGITPGAASIA